MAIRGNIEDALQKIKDSDASYADNPQAQLYLYTMSDEISTLGDALEEAKRENPRAMDWWEYVIYTFISAQISMYKEALGLAMGGNLDNAMAGLDQAMKEFRYWIGASETNHRVNRIIDELQIHTYKKVALQLMMSGKIDDAVAVLKKGYQVNMKNAEMSQGLGTLLVEMLIYSGAYEEAMDQECLKQLPQVGGGRPDDNGIDARLSLYQAASCTLSALEAEKRWLEATGWWESFKKTEPIMDPLTPHEAPEEAEIWKDFDQFKNEMNDLKQAIDARKKK
ncbi:uncharacterized protein LOC143860210 [Tasmannia lanceolata]|uniref:uncharacterized protein LOC143860210 n=1 Tax=Tasmannia lanceolata TaxID=3420 RepID=UPI004064A94B